VPAVVLLIMATLGVFYSGAAAQDSFTATITIRDHRFEPAELHVPAGKRILLTVINADPLSEEFDSTALKVEKVIAGKSQGIVHISPLNPGRYDFTGEYHEDTAKAGPKIEPRQQALKKAIHGSRCAHLHLVSFPWCEDPEHGAPRSLTPLYPLHVNLPMSAWGLGRVKTKSDLVVMPSARQIFAFFCSPSDRRAQNSGCDYTA
jgi:hypothetical protein